MRVGLPVVLISLALVLTILAAVPAGRVPLWTAVFVLIVALLVERW